MLKEPLFAPLPIPFSAFSRVLPSAILGGKRVHVRRLLGTRRGGYLSQSLEATGSHLGRRRRMLSPFSRSFRPFFRVWGPRLAHDIPTYLGSPNWQMSEHKRSGFERSGLPVGLPTGVNHVTIQPALIHSAFLLVGTSAQRRQYSMPLPL